YEMWPKEKVEAEFDIDLSKYRGSNIADRNLPTNNQSVGVSNWGRGYNQQTGDSYDASSGAFRVFFYWSPVKGGGWQEQRFVDVGNSQYERAGDQMADFHPYVSYRWNAEIYPFWCTGIIYG